MELAVTADRGKLRAFGAIWLPLFLGGIAWTLVRRGSSPAAPLAAAAVSVTLALLSPRLLRPVFLALVYATAPVGFVVSRALLTVLFFFFVTPLGWLERRRGAGGPFDLTQERAARSYWKSRKDAREVESYFRQS